MNKVTGTSRYSRDRPEPLLDIADLRRWLGVSRSTIYRLVDAGALTPVYLDRRPRFEAHQVRELIEARGGRSSS